MELKEGMYIRFEGMINKILELDEDYIVFDVNWYDHWADEISRMKIDEFIKEYKPVFKDNIIDLIEVGDYVNGRCVGRSVHNGFIKLEVYSYDDYGDDYLLVNEDIKSIVTKEQFENMSYKVGE